MRLAASRPQAAGPVDEPQVRAALCWPTCAAAPGGGRSSRRAGVVPRATAPAPGAGRDPVLGAVAGRSSRAAQAQSAGAGRGPRRRAASPTTRARRARWWPCPTPGGGWVVADDARPSARGPAGRCRAQLTVAAAPPARACPRGTGISRCGPPSWSPPTSSPTPRGAGPGGEPGHRRWPTAAPSAGKRRSPVPAAAAAAGRRARPAGAGAVVPGGRRAPRPQAAAGGRSGCGRRLGGAAGGAAREARRPLEALG